MSKVIGWVGIVLAMWGFIWGIFLEEFLWLCLFGFIMGWVGIILEDRGL